MTTHIELMNQIEKICFSTAERIVVLVAIQDAQDQPPIEEYGPGILPRKRADFAGDCRCGDAGRGCMPDSCHGSFVGLNPTDGTHEVRQRARLVKKSCPLVLD